MKKQYEIKITSGPNLLQGLIIESNFTPVELELLLMQFIDCINELDPLSRLHISNNLHSLVESVNRASLNAP